VSSSLNRNTGVATGEQDLAVEAALVVTVLEELLLKVVPEVQEEEDIFTSVIRGTRRIMVVPRGPRIFLAVSRSTQSVTL
jgi:hypothetical protein